MISSLVVREPAERLSIEQALQHEWLTPRAFSSHTSADSGRSSSDAHLSPPAAHPDATVVHGHSPHQPSDCEAEILVQGSQDEGRNSSDAQQPGTPRSSSSRRYDSRKPEARRPNGNPTGPVRSTFRRHTFASSSRSSTQNPIAMSPPEGRCATRNEVL
eukprot:TRINITY_DN8540_c0_g1_i5.p2 TRINITY_DN8540_c0_g1~~TRINITY_DN8540_c0_g1_i5.p2  ORF type:complete len:159 (-),score=6.80 TRINITY_DN8540_c0_g1_i5:367-843(-)